MTSWPLITWHRCGRHQFSLRSEFRGPHAWRLVYVCAVTFPAFFLFILFLVVVFLSGMLLPCSFAKPHISRCFSPRSSPHISLRSRGGYFFFNSRYVDGIPFKKKKGVPPRNDLVGLSVNFPLCGEGPAGAIDFFLPPLRGLAWKVPSPLAAGASPHFPGRILLHEDLRLAEFLFFDLGVAPKGGFGGHPALRRAFVYRCRLSSFIPESVFDPSFPHHRPRGTGLS